MKATALSLPLTLLLGLVAGTTACSGGGSGSDSSGSTPGGARTGTVEFLATDAPLDPSLVESAFVDITKIRLHKDADADSGFVTVYDGAPMRIGLEGLRNDITNGFASGVLEVGTYHQLRLHLSGGELNLKNGNTYTVEDGTLSMPSSMKSSGYKVMFDPGIVVPEGGKEHVLLDFDLTKTFQPIPGSSPETAREYKLRPVIRGAVMSISGELRATVQRDDGMGNLVPVPDAMVYVLAAGEMDTANAVASTITDANGMAAVLGLLPEVYDVVASDGMSEVRVDGNQVVTGDSVLVDLVLP